MLCRTSTIPRNTGTFRTRVGNVDPSLEERNVTAVVLKVYAKSPKQVHSSGKFAITPPYH